MDAIEFVKKHGIAVAKDLAYRDKTSIGYLSVEHYNLNQDNLKQIVQAFSVVNALGGLHMAKADIMDLDGFEKESPYWINVKKAINLVEQCQND